VAEGCEIKKPFTLTFYLFFNIIIHIVVVVVVVVYEWLIFLVSSAQPRSSIYRHFGGSLDLIDNAGVLSSSLRTLHSYVVAEAEQQRFLIVVDTGAPSSDAY